ncbi:MAG: hypothetical protein A4E32_01630 [Methanomassiliicoccales archaeon PtaU1.Bin124]|nr:MAG: hypothetical protein A4E32_01630 [Methanomassiliicoccales archaeon PtaU1.Bin124]
MWDKTYRLATPKFLGDDLSSLAVLTGGKKMTVKASFFRLKGREMIALIPSENIEEIVVKANVPANRGENGAERDILQRCQTTVRLLDVIKGSERSMDVKKMAEEAERRLISLSLLRSEKDLRSAWILYIVLFASIMALGVARVALVLINGGPLDFLLLPMGFFAMGMVTYGRPKRPTILGHKFLREVRADMRWAISTLEQGKWPAGVDAGKLVTLFGAETVGLHPVFRDLKNAFPDGVSYSSLFEYSNESMD